MFLPGGVAVNSVQIEIESWWTGARRAFAVKPFYKNNDSYVATQREFRKKFGIHRNSKVPSVRALKTWVNNFEKPGSTVKKKVGSVKTVRTPQNIDAVRASLEQRPRLSAVRHSKKLGLSESSVRRILHCSTLFCNCSTLFGNCSTLFGNCSIHFCNCRKLFGKCGTLFGNYSTLFGN